MLMGLAVGLAIRRTILLVWRHFACMLALVESGETGQY